MSTQPDSPDARQQRKQREREQEWERARDRERQQQRAAVFNARTRSTVAVLSSCYVIALIALFAIYTFSAGFRDAVPDTLGILPIGVPFFGALGGTLISMWGVTDHRKDWDGGYLWWHVTRPLAGAVVGSVGCLLFWVIVSAADTQTAGPDATTFSAIAFVLGYREAAFRELVTKIVDTILLPGEKQPEDESPTAPEPRSTPAPEPTPEAG